MGKIRDVFQIINNELKADELITKKDAIDSPSDFCGRTIEEIDNEFNIECLRKVGDIYYAVFDTCKYGLLYLVFSTDYQNKNNDNYYLVSYLYRDESPNSNDFDELIIDKSSLAEVKQIDPLGLYFFEFGRTDINNFSCHMTNDGYSIFIHYQIEESIIIDVKKEINEYFIGNYLLLIDQ